MFDDGGPWGMHGGVGWGAWLVMTILLILLAALVVAIVIALLRTAGGNSPPATYAEHGSPTEAQRLLDERYARGEIDEIEYLHRRAVLRGS